MKLDKLDSLFILKWLVLWASLMGFNEVILKANGYYQMTHPELVAPLFLFGALFGFWFFDLKTEFLRLNNLRVQMIGLVICSAIFFILPRFLVKATPLLGSDEQGIAREGFQFVLLSNGVVITKWSEILFQQFFIWGFVHHLKNKGLERLKVVFLFGTVFFFLHSFLFFNLGTMATLLVLPSLFGAMGFVYCVLSLKYGYVWSMALHQGFYLMLAMGLRIGF